MVFSISIYIKDFNYGQIEDLKNSEQYKYGQCKYVKFYNVRYFYGQVDMSKYGKVS